MATIKGTKNADVLLGTINDDLIDGGAGADTMTGLAGDDIYVIDNVDDVVVENPGEGEDTVRIIYSNADKVNPIVVSLADYPNVENLEVLGKGLFDIVGDAEDNELNGNASNNEITGGDGNDRLDGGKGVDTMIGGDGDDIYGVDNINDVVIEGVGEGSDVIFSSVTYTLPDNVEGMLLLGKSKINATGNALDNELQGNAGANILDGVAGTNTLRGGLGDDTYIVRSLNDTVIENANEGKKDTVRAHISYTLGANVENLTLEPGAGNIDGTGNGLANIITGNSGNNVLDGAGGVDKLLGGLGDDTYIVDLLSTNGKSVKLEDKVTEGKDAGNDTLQLRAGALGLTAAATIKMTSNIETLDISLTGSNLLNLTGGKGDDTLIGNDAANVINGGAGVDTMTGGDGDDIYIFDNAADTAVEAPGEGNDTVRIAFKNASKTVPILINIAAMANVENVEITGTGLFNVTGNADDNNILGNASANTLNGGDGNDTLDGGKGADTLIGGDGDDTYYVDHAGDTVTELVGEGADTVISSLTYVLQEHVENLTLTGKATINGTGNQEDNTITGNDGNNVLDGVAGTNTLEGGKGNDTYIVRSVNDTVVEQPGEGTDTVRTDLDYVLDANVENLVLTGDADVDGTGNNLNNVITGNAGNNILDGDAGADTLIGGLGDDTYIVDITANGAASVRLQDTISEAANGGTDTLELRAAALGLTGAAIVTLQSNLENLDASGTGVNLLNLTGNTLANVITGNDADNVIDGGTGNDTLFGNAGNDILWGGLGNDALFGGSEADILIGGGGRDRFFYASPAESSLASMDSITDFAFEDRLTLMHGAGYTAVVDQAYTFAGLVADTITAIDADGGIVDSVVYFTDGVDGYFYVKGAGTGDVSYDGLVVRLDTRTSPFPNDVVEQGIVFEDESASVTQFEEGATVIGALSSASDTDNYVSDTPTAGLLVVNFDSPDEYSSNDPVYTISVRTLSGGLISEWSVSGDRTVFVPVSTDNYKVEIKSAANFDSDEYSFTVETQAHTTLNMDDSVTDTIAQEGDVHSYDVALTAGEIYHFSLTGTDNLIDPKIRIFDPAGRQILVRDDTTTFEGDGVMIDAFAGFVAPVSGTYHVTVEAVNHASNPLKQDIVDGNLDPLDYGAIAQTGEYTLAVENIAAADAAGELLMGPKWGADPRGSMATVSYSFNTALSEQMAADANWWDDQYQPSTFRGFTAAQQQVVHDVLEYFEQVSGITFTYDASGDGDLTFGWMRPDDLGGAGAAYLYDTNGDPLHSVDDMVQDEIGFASVILSYYGSSPNNINLNTNELRHLLLHEIGHVLGLEHTGVYSPDFGPTTGLPAGMDNDAYTVMAYPGKLDSGKMADTLQVLDIEALQVLYGPSVAGANTGDNTYTYTGSSEYFETIYDTGGTDTIDASALATNSVIHLAAGSASSIGNISVGDIPANVLAAATITGEILDKAYANVTISFDAVIENATGGSGNDYISGNDANNVLIGGAGDDILIGGLGEDTLTGGLGADIFVFDDLLTIDNVLDFNAAEGDVLDIRDLLSGFFDSALDDIDNFVEIAMVGDDAYLAVDQTGMMMNWQPVIALIDTPWQVVQDLYDNGNLLAG